MTNEKDSVLDLLKRSFSRGSWHGPSVMETLAGVTQEMSFHRFPHSHSIIELVAHMISWRIYVAKRLQHDNTYEVGENNNFPASTDWVSVLKDLDASQQMLLQAIQNSDESKWNDVVPNASHRYTFYTLLHGIIHHDLYHTGQIGLIKKDYLEGHTKQF